MPEVPLPPQMPTMPDTMPVVRVNLQTRVLDTLAWMKDGKVKINDANVIASIPTSNGMIHVIDAVLLPPRRAAAIAAGLWHDRTINDDLDACVAAYPTKVALTAVRSQTGEMRGEVRRFTYEQLATLADRIAVGLSRLGVGRDDVVAMQLPNWWQFSLLYLACSRIGAVLNPLMHIFRERELSFMLKHGEAKVLIVPKVFRGFEHEAMARGLQPVLPDLRRIVVVGGGGADDFDALLTLPEWEKQPDAKAILDRNRPGPDDITQLIYTSGTTGEPKGALHTQAGMGANIDMAIAVQGFNENLSVLAMLGAYALAQAWQRPGSQDGTHPHGGQQQREGAGAAAVQAKGWWRAGTTSSAPPAATCIRPCRVRT